MMGYQFNRQKPLGRYIVDFYCKPLNLVIEIDGDYHNEDRQRVADEERQKALEGFELNFLRFAEIAVRTDMPNVRKIIETYILEYEERFPEVKLRAQRYSSL